MMLFFGKPKGAATTDENASRAGRLQALRSHFYAWKKWKEFAPDASFQPHAIQQMLNALEQKPVKHLRDYSGDSSILVLNAHGNATVFNGYTGQQVATMLQNLGISEAGTREIWVAACSVALQKQQPGPAAISRFVNDLRFHLLQAGLDIKVYGPRNILWYRGGLVPVGDEQKYQYNEVYIAPRPAELALGKERSYAFNEGWLLAHP